ncbi:ribonuclease HII [Clostridia bacterium]|nr:ribonuclease HII [Clostridia bacterium]
MYAAVSEKERLKALCSYENELYGKGYSFLAGIDEVGRGCLAGCVVACAVILPAGFTYAGINDSKKVSPKRREALSEILREKAVSVGIGAIDAETIDNVNILQATILAMCAAVANLDLTPEYLLIDALKLPLDIPQTPITGGDAKSISIASASIVAKVYRDNLMRELDKLYPEYGFAQNKGYGTAAHIAAIKKHGLCPVHRRSFNVKK